MTKGKEKAPIFLVRKGLALWPETDFDAEFIETIPYGHSVEVSFKRARSSERNRAYWKMLHEVVKATGVTLTPERLHDVIKLEVGIVELVRLPSGMKVALPGSIAFDKMDETEMVAFFRAAEEFLAREFGYVNERLAA